MTQPEKGSRFGSVVPRTALNAIRGTTRRLLGNVKAAPRPGRPRRIAESVSRKIKPGPLLDVLPQPSDLGVRLELDEAFGKPLLVSLDLVVSSPLHRLSELSEPERDTLVVLFTDLLDRALQAAWDNPEVAPVAVRGRVIVQSDGSTPRSLHPSRHPHQTVIVDTKSLGFEDEIARAEDLYARFGAPAADPGWHPN